MFASPVRISIKPEVAESDALAAPKAADGRCKCRLAVRLASRALGAGLPGRSDGASTRIGPSLIVCYCSRVDSDQSFRRRCVPFPMLASALPHGRPMPLINYVLTV